MAPASHVIRGRRDAQHQESVLTHPSRRIVSVLSASAAGAVGIAVGGGRAAEGASMIASLYRAARERRWNRDRRRRIAAMLEWERSLAVGRVDAMAAQLEEIRSLPEADPWR